MAYRAFFAVEEEVPRRPLAAPVDEEGELTAEGFRDMIRRHRRCVDRPLPDEPRCPSCGLVAILRSLTDDWGEPVHVVGCPGCRRGGSWRCSEAAALRGWRDSLTAPVIDVDDCL